MKGRGNTEGGTRLRLIRAACPLCDDARWRPRATARGAEAVRCLGCGIVYARAVASPGTGEATAGLYGERYFDRYLRDGGYEQRAARDRRRVRLLARWAPRGRLLDIGCSLGHFVEAAASLGWDATGVEPAPFAAEFARSRGLAVIQGALADAALPDAHFDAVTLWHVVEHLPDARGDLAEARRVLRPGGLLVILTPDIGHPAARLQGRRWKHLRDEHLQLFSHRTLPAFLRRSGFAVRHCRWLWRHSEVLAVAVKG